MKTKLRILLFLLFLLSACTSPAKTLEPSPQAIASETIAPAQVVNTSMPVSGPSRTPHQAPSPTPTYMPESWMTLPVYPEAISQRMIETYLLGQSFGNNPRAFSRMGDCDSLPFSFLGDFDAGSQAYNLGEHVYLTDVVEYFQGSYGRTGVTAKDGFNSASVLSPIWADQEVCDSNETPLQCEVRVNQPSFMLIALGSNDFGQPDRFENNMRQIIDYLLSHGVIPILGTKADNLEGDHRINSLIGQLAYEYELPLWNFWLAIQPLDNHGVRDDDNYHPTHPGFGGTPNDFSNPVNMRYGFPWRNLTALQVLDVVMLAATDHNP